LAPERIDPETSRRSTLPGPKPIPPGQPKWVIAIYTCKRDNHMGEWMNCSTEAGNRQRMCRRWPEVYYDTLPLGPNFRS